MQIQHQLFNIYKYIIILCTVLCCACLLFALAVLSCLLAVLCCVVLACLLCLLACCACSLASFLGCFACWARCACLCDLLALLHFALLLYRFLHLCLCYAYVVPLCLSFDINSYTKSRASATEAQDLTHFEWTQYNPQKLQIKIL